MTHIYIMTAAIMTAALVVAGWVVLLIVSRRTILRRCAEHRREFDRQIEALSANVKALEGAEDAPTIAPVAPGDGRAAAQSSEMVERIRPSVAETNNEIAPETVALITQTITALLGRKVLVRSVKLLQMPNEAPDIWAQQGRVVVQASHNLGQRGHEL